MVSQIPMFINCLNIGILAISFITFVKVVTECHRLPVRSWQFLLYMGFMASILCCFGVNITAAIHHYTVYFIDQSPRTENATWLKFIDRYFMALWVVVNNIKAFRAKSFILQEE